MEIPFLHLKTNERNTVPQPEGIELFRAALWMAAGMVGISFLATSLPMKFKLILCILGGIFCVVGIIRLFKYHKAYKVFQNFMPTWDFARGIYDQFAMELNAWHETDTVPTCCDGDTLYFLKLQKERLKRKGLKMSDQILPAKESGSGTATLSRKSLWYTSDMVYENISRKLRFDNTQGTLYERNVEQVMYQIIVHSPNETQLTNITATCPNCGAVSPVAALEEGCRYCGTKFRITDLFPRVVNLFFMKLNSTTTNSVIMKRTMSICMLAFFIFTFVAVLLSPAGFLPAKLAGCFAVSIFCGGFLGIILTDLILLFSLFDRDGMKHVSAFKLYSSKAKIKNSMQQFDPKYSFDKFEGQIISLVKMAVFAEDPQNLACYHGTERDPRFSDILEMTYTNATCLKKSWMEGNILHLSLRTWWINYSEFNGKIYKTGDCIDLEVCTNVTVLEPPGFSITSVSCPCCGGSFDAVRQKVCPYCGSTYHMENEGWVITDMKLIR